MHSYVFVTVTGGQRAWVVGSTGFGAGGEASACHLGSKLYSRFVGPCLPTWRSKRRGRNHARRTFQGGQSPAPEEIRLYTPFNNRECLHCHAGMRAYLEEPKHTKQASLMAKLNSNQVSCMTSGCHDIVHNVATLKDATFWHEAK